MSLAQWVFHYKISHSTEVNENQKPAKGRTIHSLEKTIETVRIKMASLVLAMFLSLTEKRFSILNFQKYKLWSLVIYQFMIQKSLQIVQTCQEKSVTEVLF